jgi:predicted MPP superfamily phosphohydrolase
MPARFIVFFSIVLVLHGLINYYIFIHGWHALVSYTALRPYYIAVFVVVALSYLTGQVLERNAPSILSDVLVWTGAFWFAMMVYFLIALGLLDIIRLVNHFVPIYPEFIRQNYATARTVFALMLVGGVTIAIFFGYLNAINPRVKHLAFKIDKPLAHKKLRIVALSDQHLGTIIGRSRLQDMVEKINSCDPDIVLLGGDQVDGDPRPSMARGLGELFDSIHSRYGIFAITGNHEYIGDVEKSCVYLAEHNVRWLRDTSVVVEGLTIVGREDRSAPTINGKGRKSLAELMQTVDKSKPVILLDHQPFHLEEAEENGVDLQFSGHTHHAQIWPLSYITKRVYEVSWGYKKKGNTHVYVSCGAGTWGPPVRIGNTPEIMCFDIEFGG